MAKRKKSIYDLNKQFNRIWDNAVKESDFYKSLPDDMDEGERFRLADRTLLENVNGYRERSAVERVLLGGQGSRVELSERDKQLYRRVNKADNIATRYQRNIESSQIRKQRKAGAPYTVTDKSKKESRNVYMGLSEG